MNRAVARKLGETLALANEAETVVNYGWSALSDILGNDLTWVERRNDMHREAIKRIAEKHGALDAMQDEADESGATLGKMRNLYIRKKSDWNDVTKVLEWIGFFEGSALVQWKYLLGVSESTRDDELRKLAIDATAFHEMLLLSAGSEEAAAGSRAGAFQQAFVPRFS